MCPHGYMETYGPHEAAAMEQSQLARPAQPTCPGMKYPMRDHSLTLTKIPG